ncbi:hypothetical protein PVT67_18670 [Gallaecimonas kandeliae]|nr:hypothetical protein [Gallaecimonas kandeliae]WKE65658.1 hypothetical protein PVT67_18670 [Gallaecimonas kandeliae]
MLEEPAIPHRTLLIWSYQTLLELLEEPHVTLWDEYKPRTKR